MAIFLSALLVVGAMLAAAIVLRFLRADAARRPSQLDNLLLVALSLTLTLFALEVFFGRFVAISDGFAFTLSSRRWFDRYWSPVNSYGYRDLEHDPALLKQKKVVFVVGDSLVAGHGIKDPRERFGDVLAAQLGESWVVVNIARRGWSTRQELEAMVSYPARPDAIILSYFINDIEGAAIEAGVPRPDLVVRPSGLLGWVVAKSQVVNFFYWRLFRFRTSREMTRRYMDFLRLAYEDNEIWGLHEWELVGFAKYSRDRGIASFAVVFPSLFDVAGTAGFAGKAADVLRREGVEVIDLSLVLRDKDPASLVVNVMDGHPSVEVHRQVAALLYRSMARRVLN